MELVPTESNGYMEPYEAQRVIGGTALSGFSLSIVIARNSGTEIGAIPSSSLQSGP